jgi:hypothetical protein
VVGFLLALCRTHVARSWGGIGLLFTLGFMFNVGGTAATSSEFIIAITLQWIGGMVFFGFAAILLSINKGHQKDRPSDIRISE